MNTTSAAETVARHIIRRHAGAIGQDAAWVASRVYSAAIAGAAAGLAYRRAEAAATLAAVDSPARIRARLAAANACAVVGLRPEDATMTTWTITSRTSGADLGTYEAATAQGALDAMARDAGYKDAADAAAVSGDDGSHLVTTARR